MRTTKVSKININTLSYELICIYLSYKCQFDYPGTYSKHHGSLNIICALLIITRTLRILEIKSIQLRIFVQFFLTHSVIKSFYGYSRRNSLGHVTPMVLILGLPVGPKD